MPVIKVLVSYIWVISRHVKKELTYIGFRLWLISIILLLIIAMNTTILFMTTQITMNTIGWIDFEDKKSQEFCGYLLNHEIKYPRNFLYSRSRFLCWTSRGEMEEVKTPFLSPTGRTISLGKTVAAIIRRFNDSTCNSTISIIIVVKFSAALECLSNGGHKISL